MKNYLKIAGTTALFIGFILGLFSWPNAPYGENMFYYIGWWWGAIGAAGLLFGLPIGTVIWLVVTVAKLNSKDVKATAGE